MSLVLSENTLKRDLVTKVKTIFTINDFDLETNRSQRYVSEVFTIGSNEWQIEVTPRYVEDGVEHLGCFICLLKSHESKVLAKCECFVINGDFDFVHRLRYKHEFVPKGSGNGCLLLTLDQLIAQKDQLMPKNVLTIGFDIEINTQVIDYGLGLNEYRNQFNVKEFNDFKIIVGKKSFFVSKLILSSRSEVFKAMFTTNMTESQTNELIVEDIKEEVMEGFLKYLYFGFTSRLEPLVEDLLLVSDKYLVLDLKTICEEILYFELNPKNAVKTLKLFEKYNCNEMVIKTIDFITDNMNQFIDSQHFKPLFSGNDLIQPIVKQMVTKTSNKRQRTGNQLKTYSYSYFA